MANSKSNTVSVIDAFTNAVVDSIAGHTPQAFGAFIGPVAPPAPPALVLAAMGIPLLAPYRIRHRSEA
ncbi:MAG TPA: hypothetical protein VGG72_02140 [Bryobacteraceae bacterium]